MKIRYELQTPWPTDADNPDGLTGVDWIKHSNIPFLPVVGMHIDSGDGDLRKVLEVYWSADDPKEVAVFFSDDIPRPLDYWTRGGWQSEDITPATSMPSSTAP